MSDVVPPSHTICVSVLMWERKFNTVFRLYRCGKIVSQVGSGAMGNWL